MSEQLYLEISDTQTENQCSEIMNEFNFWHLQEIKFNLNRINVKLSEHVEFLCNCYVVVTT